MDIGGRNALVLGSGPWQRSAGAFEIGDIAAWILTHADQGVRGKSQGGMHQC
jgi:hypothetical protein